MSQEELFARRCPRCDETGKTFVPRPPSEKRGNHSDEIRCATCGHFFGFKAKDESERAPKLRSEISKKLVRLYSKGFCELCLRPENDIPPPQTLEGHHVIPVEDGGKDERANIQILCTSCHRLIHHQRTYLGHYRKEPAAEAQEQEGTSEALMTKAEDWGELI